MYKRLVHPHLKFCSPAWSPHYQKDKQLLGRVQHRFTRMFKHLRHLHYSTWLNILGLWSLEEWSCTRGHILKLTKNRSNKDLRHRFFSERVVNRWNKLDKGIVEASSLNSFKNRLAKLRHKGMGFFMDFSLHSPLAGSSASL